MAPSAMVNVMVAEADPKRYRACTSAVNFPVRVGIPEIKPVGPSQPKPEGRPDAEYQVGLLFATILYLTGAPIMPSLSLHDALPISTLVMVMLVEAVPRRLLASTWTE